MIRQDIRLSDQELQDLQSYLAALQQVKQPENVPLLPQGRPLLTPDEILSGIALAVVVVYFCFLR